MYRLLLSVRVIPWADTLKWTTVAAGRGLRAKVHLVALQTASGPVSDSVSTEFRYSTLQARLWKRWAKSGLTNTHILWRTNTQEKYDAQAASAGEKWELQPMHHMWELWKTEETKTILCPTCSLFEELGHCAGVWCILHFLEFSHQVWNISDISHFTKLSEVKSICNCLLRCTLRCAIWPFSGMRRAHGKEMGVIECWYTRADKLPGWDGQKSLRLL